MKKKNIKEWNNINIKDIKTTYKQFFDLKKETWNNIKKEKIQLSELKNKNDILKKTLEKFNNEIEEVKKEENKLKKEISQKQELLKNENNEKTKIILEEDIKKIETQLFKFKSEWYNEKIEQIKIIKKEINTNNKKIDYLGTNIQDEIQKIHKIKKWLEQNNNIDELELLKKTRLQRLKEYKKKKPLKKLKENKFTDEKNNLISEYNELLTDTKTDWKILNLEDFINKNKNTLEKFWLLTQFEQEKENIKNTIFENSFDWNNKDILNPLKIANLIEYLEKKEDINEDEKKIKIKQLQEIFKEQIWENIRKWHLIDIENLLLKKDQKQKLTTFDKELYQILKENDFFKNNIVLYKHLKEHILNKKWYENISLEELYNRTIKEDQKNKEKYMQEKIKKYEKGLDELVKSETNEENILNYIKNKVKNIIETNNLDDLNIYLWDDNYFWQYYNQIGKENKEIQDILKLKIEQGIKNVWIEFLKKVKKNKILNGFYNEKLKNNEDFQNQIKSELEQKIKNNNIIDYKENLSNHLNSNKTIQNINERFKRTVEQWGQFKQQVKNVWNKIKRHSNIANKYLALDKIEYDWDKNTIIIDIIIKIIFFITLLLIFIPKVSIININMKNLKTQSSQLTWQVNNNKKKNNNKNYLKQKKTIKNSIKKNINSK